MYEKVLLIAQKVFLSDAASRLKRYQSYDEIPNPGCTYKYSFIIMKVLLLKEDSIQ